MPFGCIALRIVEGWHQVIAVADEGVALHCRCHEWKRQAGAGFAAVA